MRFGPLQGACTEASERYNGVFRYGSGYSNHQAPSRDIALQLAAQDSLQHRITGGYWMQEGSDKWECAGYGVRDFLKAHGMLQRLLGWTPEERKIPGMFCHLMVLQSALINCIGSTKLLPLKKGEKSRTICSLASTQATMAVNYSDHNPASQWNEAKSFVAESGEEVGLGVWIFARSPIKVSLM